jgi:ubiquinone/menaquinone biosynthesis C-methylase UbiE
MIASATGYHETELANALHPDKRLLLLPPIEPKHKKILDVGCGIGQSLIACRLAADVVAFGIDPDEQLINYGATVVPSSVKLRVAPAENLPFNDAEFDFIYSRVALPYTRIGDALQEISRTLKGGGELWLVLHTAEMYIQRLRRSATQRRYKDVAYCCFILFNGMLFDTFGKQLSLQGRFETYQSKRGMRRALRRAGLELTEFEDCGKATLLVLRARKPC